MRIKIHLIAIISFAYRGYTQSVCYVCDGESAESGNYCTNDKICTGNSCIFDAQLSGEWSAGCSNETIVASTTLCIVDVALGILNCICSNNFCNEVQQMAAVLETKLPNGTVFIPLLPANLTMECFECGLIYISDTIDSLDIPCDLAHVCNGSFCVTKRGQYPHSYCATDWDPLVEGCVSRPGEDEVCACEQPLCNFPYDPQESTTNTVTPTSNITTTMLVTTNATISNTTATALTTIANATATMLTTTLGPTTTSNTSALTPATITASPTTASNTTSITLTTIANTTMTTLGTTTANPMTNPNTTTTKMPEATTTNTTIATSTSTSNSTPIATTTAPPADTTLASPCINGQFGNNPQMVSTSDALKQIIISRFGNSSAAVQHFINDINQHICSYSRP